MIPYLKTKINIWVSNVFHMLNKYKVSVTCDNWYLIGVTNLQGRSYFYITNIQTKIMTEPVGSKNVSKFKKWSKPLIGTGLCAMSSMIYTIANVLVKGVSVYKPHVVFVVIYGNSKIIVFNWFFFEIFMNHNKNNLQFVNWDTFLDLSHVDLFMVTCIRYFVMIMLASPVVMKRIEIEHPFPIGKRWLLIWRGIIAASYMIINYYAIQVRK